MMIESIAVLNFSATRQVIYYLFRQVVIEYAVWLVGHLTVYRNLITSLRHWQSLTSI